jgi:hypothetical protein
MAKPAPSEHPEYRHAVSDLRNARKHLEKALNDGYGHSRARRGRGRDALWRGEPLRVGATVVVARGGPKGRPVGSA